MKKVADKPKDIDGDGDIDADDKEIARKYSKESVELEEGSIKGSDNTRKAELKRAFRAGEERTRERIHQNQVPYRKPNMSKDKTKKAAYDAGERSVGDIDGPYSGEKRQKSQDKLATKHHDDKLRHIRNSPKPKLPESVDINLEEAADKEEQRMLQLARLGLVDKADVSKLRIALAQFKADKPLTIQQRTMLLGVMQDLISVITGDDMIFNRVKQDVREDTNEDPPFTPDPPKKNPVAKAGKHGQGYSTARHLARMALKKFQDKKQSSKQDK
jgi:hypothetical protein